MKSLGTQSGDGYRVTTKASVHQPPQSRSKTVRRAPGGMRTYRALTNTPIQPLAYNAPSATPTLDSMHGRQRNAGRLNKRLSGTVGRRPGLGYRATTGTISRIGPAGISSATNHGDSTSRGTQQHSSARNSGTQTNKLKTRNYGTQGPTFKSGGTQTSYLSGTSGNQVGAGNKGSLGKSMMKGFGKGMAYGLGGLMDMGGEMYAADKQLEGTKYTADANLEGTKYSADKGFDTTALQEGSKNFRQARYFLQYNALESSNWANARMAVDNNQLNRRDQAMKEAGLPKAVGYLGSGLKPVVHRQVNSLGGMATSNQTYGRPQQYRNTLAQDLTNIADYH